jgi:hypothetical protein
MSDPDEPNEPIPFPTDPEADLVVRVRITAPPGVIVEIETIEQVR